MSRTKRKNVPRKKDKEKNPVAKFMRMFNKPKVFRDRTKYTRKVKNSIA